MLCGFCAALEQHRRRNLVALHLLDYLQKRESNRVQRIAELQVSISCDPAFLITLILLVDLHTSVERLKHDLPYELVVHLAEVACFARVEDAVQEEWSSGVLVLSMSPTQVTRMKWRVHYGRIG